jgi:two-component system, response regulator
MREDRVLLVEDNPDDVALTLEAFRETNFSHQIEVVGDGAEALDFLFGTGKYDGRDKRLAPLMILLDLNLPKVGGLEVLRRLRADPILKHVFVLVLTSSDAHKDEADARNLCTNLYMSKATNYSGFTTLARLVQSLLASAPP